MKEGQWSWVHRVRICAPNIWALSKENVDFAHPIYGPYSMYCAPNLRLLSPPLRSQYISYQYYYTFFTAYVEKKIMHKLFEVLEKNIHSYDKLQTTLKFSLHIFIYQLVIYLNLECNCNLLTFRF